MKLALLVAADGAEWESALLREVDSLRSDVAIARRCVDVVELLAVAASGQGKVALVAASLRRFDADVVDRLIACEVAVVAVIDRGDAEAPERLAAMGVSFLVTSDSDVSVVTSTVVEAARSISTPGALPVASSRAFADPAASQAVLPPGAATAPVLPKERGMVIAVWGPTGAPGRTTTAVHLSHELAYLTGSTLLVDADVYGGVVAAVLGLLDESPGIAAACRHAASRRLNADVLAALCWQLSPSLRLLTGIPRQQRWPELRPAAVTAVLESARGLSSFTVVDCGFGLETDEELSFDTAAPRRNGATLAVLDAADVVLAVGAADPIGMQRLIRGLDELGQLEVDAPIWVVLNKVRGSVVPGDPAAELSAALHRFAGRVPAAMLPFDQEALDTALVAGQSLRQSRAGTALHQAVAELAERLVGNPDEQMHSRRAALVGARLRRKLGQLTRA